MIQRMGEKNVRLHGADETPARTSVAVVADDQGFREALTFQLVTAGFEVSAHSSAESFLESERLKEKDCVIADIYLPGLNGLQLLAEIKQSMSCAQVVFLTDQVTRAGVEVAHVTLRCRTRGQSLFESVAAPVSLITYLCSAIALRIGQSAIERLRFIEGIHDEWGDLVPGDL